MVSFWPNMKAVEQWRMWLINVYINICKTAFWKCKIVVIKNITKSSLYYAKNKYLNDVKQVKNKYLNNARINTIKYLEKW